MIFYADFTRLRSVFPVGFVAIPVRVEVIIVKHFLFWLVVGLVIAGVVLKIKGVF